MSDIILEMNVIVLSFSLVTIHFVHEQKSFSLIKYEQFALLNQFLILINVTLYDRYNHQSTSLRFINFIDQTT